MNDPKDSRASAAPIGSTIEIELSYEGDRIVIIPDDDFCNLYLSRAQAVNLLAKLPQAITHVESNTKGQPPPAPDTP